MIINYHELLIHVVCDFGHSTLHIFAYLSSIPIDFISHIILHFPHLLFLRDFFVEKYRVRLKIFFCRCKYFHALIDFIQIYCECLTVILGSKNLSNLNVRDFFI